MQLKPGMLEEYDNYRKINSTDQYSERCVTFSEDWAELMEKSLSEGDDIFSGIKGKTIADECSHRADTDGITGFMYGCAVSALSHFWIHGEELRRWHNIATQINQEGIKANDSGGVLNPALISIEV
jgi:hypothetical protein